MNHTPMEASRKFSKTGEITNAILAHTDPDTRGTESQYRHIIRSGIHNIIT
jgi:hypothetical protein